MTVAEMRVIDACGLDTICDKRFRGVAVGVGMAKIVGKIHLERLLAISVSSACKA